MNIPQDLLDEILSLLPVKSLIRFKVVCKDWYSNIESHSFKAKHFKNQNTKNKILIYHHQRLNHSFVFSICSEKEKEVSGDDGLTLFHQYDNQQDLLDQVKIIGTCNGLVCVDYNECRLHSKVPTRFLALWNPATREFKTLPKFRPCLRLRGTERYGDHVGFGFDSANNDYKVISVLQFLKMEPLYWRRKEYTVKIEIYSLSTNSWRELDCSGFSTKITGPSTIICTTFGEEKFCWLVRSRKEMAILSLDMGKEVFQKTPLPSDYENFEGTICDTDLFNLHDSIALVHHRGTHKTFEIWTTKEFEQEGNSWIKLSCVNYHSRIGHALGFWKCKNSNNILLLFSQRPDGIKGVYMDNRDQIKTDGFMTIKVKNDSIGLPIKVLTYIETLVSVK